MSQSSVIGSGTVIRGSLDGEGSLEIFGHVEGDVSMTGEVTIAAGAAVLGNVSGSKISVHGSVQGDLRGTESVLLERGAKVIGDLSAPRVGVGAGALIRGSVRTEGEPVAAAAKRPATLGIRPVAFAERPLAKAEPKPQAVPSREREPIDALANREPPREPAALREPPPAPRAKEPQPERRAPAPVLPSLGKAAKARKK